jgi:general secretion pathway protein B
MSLILDALRKAEQERNRQGGPGLHGVRIAAQRQGLPLWVAVIGVVLLANLALLAWLLLRPVAPPVAVVTGVPGSLPMAAPLPTVIEPTASPLPDPALASTPLPAALPELPTTGLDATALPAEQLRRAPPVATGPAQPAAAPTLAGERLPSAQDISSSGTRLPALRLSLHVYDRDPALRYVLLNSLQLHEGDVTPEGLRLERITDSGVVLVWRGQRFSLQPGE